MAKGDWLSKAIILHAPVKCISIGQQNKEVGLFISDWLVCCSIVDCSTMKMYLRTKSQEVKAVHFIPPWPKD